MSHTPGTSSTPPPGVALLQGARTLNFGTLGFPRRAVLATLPRHRGRLGAPAEVSKSNLALLPRPRVPSPGARVGTLAPRRSHPWHPYTPGPRLELALLRELASLGLALLQDPHTRPWHPYANKSTHENFMRTNVRLREISSFRGARRGAGFCWSTPNKSAHENFMQHLFAGLGA
jgi:hypothetical protein